MCQLEEILFIKANKQHSVRKWNLWNNVENFPQKTPVLNAFLIGGLYKMNWFYLFPKLPKSFFSMELFLRIFLMEFHRPKDRHRQLPRVWITFHFNIVLDENGIRIWIKKSIVIDGDEGLCVMGSLHNSPTSSPVPHVMLSSSQGHFHLEEKSSGSHRAPYEVGSFSPPMLR